jgi:DNA-binding beta-propeller fold protein YncE
MRAVPNVRWSIPLILCAAASAASAQVVVQNLQIGPVDDAEITPDGRWIVLREHMGLPMGVRILDAHTGELVLSTIPPAQGFGGAAQDAVAVTNERAIVIGSSGAVFDLTQPTPTLIASLNVGNVPRDVMITPDGTKALVRGGWDTDGLVIIDLASGTVLAHAPGEPTMVPNSDFDVDSVVGTDTHGVFLSVEPSAQTTRVTIFDLAPAGGGPPSVVLTTSPTGSARDQLGPPHDVTLAGNGAYAAVRSQLSVALYKLDGAATAQVWHKRLFGDPGPFLGTALDSIEGSPSRIATISRREGAVVGAQLDVFDLAGNQWHAPMDGEPHDLALTPNGQRLVVRTTAGVYLFNVAQLPAGALLTPLDFVAAPSVGSSFGNGLDSVEVTATRAITLHRMGPQTSQVRLWDLSNDTLAAAGTFGLPNKPCDVAISPDGHWAAVSGTDYAQVYDLVTATQVLTHDSAPSVSGFYPWCDGVALDNARAVAFGYVDDGQQPISGWATVIDLDPAAYRYCPGLVNSTGSRGDLEPTGSTSVALNSAGMLATNLPKNSVCALFFGTQSTWIPFGHGTLCVSGERYTPGAMSSGPSGSAHQPLDFLGLPSQGGVITPGSIWYFQVWYRDSQLPGSGINTTNAVKLAFQP